MIRPITDTLRHIGGGVFIDIASDKLAELVAAVDSGTAMPTASMPACVTAFATASWPSGLS